MMTNEGNKKNGFTLIELLVIVAILGLLSSVILVSTNNARKKARDAIRLSNIEQLQKALEFYYDKFGYYPPTTPDACCDGWDQSPCGADRTFIDSLKTQGLLTSDIYDPGIFSGAGCYGYNYYRYNAGSSGCDAGKGSFYVLGVRDMETSGRPHPQSPGFACASRDWSNEFEWVTGIFEN